MAVFPKGPVVHYGHGFYAYGADAAEEVDDLLLVVGEAVGVEALADGGVAGLALPVLVQDPFQGGAAAEFVPPRFIGDAGERGLFVQPDDAPSLSARRMVLGGRPSPRLSPEVGEGDFSAISSGYGSADSKPMCRSSSCQPIAVQWWKAWYRGGRGNSRRRSWR